MEGLSADMHSILSDSSSSDLTLVCPDGEVQVHRCIMAGRSPVFKSLLESDMMEMKSGRVRIQDFEIKVVRAMVLYIYTAKIEDSFDDILSLMKIGKKYLIQLLVDDCSKKLIKLITVSNVLELGSVAEIFSVQDLVECCAQFVSENLDALGNDWKEKLKSSPQFLLGIVDFMKTDESIEISRFTRVDQPSLNDRMWSCRGINKDAICVQLSNDATLTSVGLFGTKNTNPIQVKISVIDSESETLFFLKTSYKSTGTEEPTRVPVYLEMVAHIKYTISVVITSDYLTFYGRKGKLELDYGGKLKVVLKDSSESMNMTNARSGQIPILGFKI